MNKFFSQQRLGEFAMKSKQNQKFFFLLIIIEFIYGLIVKNNTYRIIDYKTGGDSKKIRGLDDLFSTKKKDRNDAVFEVTELVNTDYLIPKISTLVSNFSLVPLNYEYTPIFSN